MLVFAVSHRAVCTIFSLLLLSACSLNPQELNRSEITTITSDDRAKVIDSQVIPGSVITLDGAIARALKYNLNHRVKTLGEALASGNLAAGKYDMLPKLLVNAGYNWRDSYSLRYRATPSNPNVFDTNRPFDLSIDRKHFTSNLGLSWNILDFGASYYTAKQNGDRLLVAKEQRRKAMHILMQEVRTAYWRAVASEMLRDRVKETTVDAERALKDANDLSSSRVRTPDESLRYQRNLLENLRLLEGVDRDLATARIELVNLMGLQPGTKFNLEKPSTVLPELNADIQDMETVALMHNADLRSQMYNVRIAAIETRKALLKMLPGINLNFGKNYDNDRYLYEDNWDQAAINVSANLFNILSGPSKMRAVKANVAVEEARRTALQMMVLTQVHLSRYQYVNAVRQYERADQIFNVDTQLEEIMRGKFESNTVGEQVSVAASVSAIFSELRRYEAMAKAQEAIGKLQATLGLEPVFSSVDDFTLDQMKDIVGQWLDDGLEMPVTEELEMPATEEFEVSATGDGDA